jgi:hypothetical protein
MEITFTFLVQERKGKCFGNLYADKGCIEMDVSNYVMRIYWRDLHLDRDLMRIFMKRAMKFRAPYRM